MPGTARSAPENAGVRRLTQPAANSRGPTPPGAGVLPQVLLLDELTTFLDYEDQDNVLRCVRDIVHASSGGGSDVEGGGGRAGSSSSSSVTALWVTHRLEELPFADSVSLMEGGKIAFTGTPGEAAQLMRRLGALL